MLILFAVVIVTLSIISFYMASVSETKVSYIVWMMFNSTNGMFGISKGFIAIGAILVAIIAGKLKNG